MKLLKIFVIIITLFVIGYFAGIVELKWEMANKDCDYTSYGIKVFGQAIMLFTIHRCA
jgi:hypothetical protein